MQSPQSILPVHVDSTMMSCARSCMRKFQHEFVWGLRPRLLSVDLHAGACFATALEATYKSYYDGAPLHDAINRAGMYAFAEAWGDFTSEKDTPKTFDGMWAAVESYFDQYPPQADHVQPYIDSDGKPTFEFSFAIPLDGPDWPEHPSGGPFIYSGRFDKLGTYHGKTLPCDEKTTARLDSKWADQWNLRSQFIGYVWACRQLGLTVDSVCVRGVVITKRQPVRHVEAIKIYSDDLIARWLEQLRRDLWRIRRAWDEGYFDYNFGESCTAYSGCMFTELCRSRAGMATIDEFTVRRWNPLDKNPEQKVLAI